MKKVIASIATGLILAGTAACGGGGNTYESTGAVINDLNNKAGIYCNGDGSGETVVGISEDCVTNDDLNPDEGVTDNQFYTVTIYGSSDQREEAKEYLTSINPSTYYVFGENWSVGLDSQSLADKVANKLGGEVLAPEFAVESAPKPKPEAKQWWDEQHKEVKPEPSDAKPADFPTGRYPHQLKFKIDAFAEEGNCTGLQTIFDEALSDDDIMRAKTGEGTQDLVAYIVFMRDQGPC